jgi:hypothetical protein
MDNILIYAILGGSIGILVYMVLCEMRKTSAYGSVNYLQSSPNDVLQSEDDEKDDENPGATIQNLSMKNTLCSDAVTDLTAAISKLRKEHRNRRDILRNKLTACNVSFGKKLIASKKFRDNTETDEAFLTKLKINRSLFKPEI